MDKKVIGIGFHKTGSTTLGEVLTELGYNVLGTRRDLLNKIEDEAYESIFEIADGYNAFQDNPWPLLYAEFDTRYPNSKFILTIRDEEKWIKSVVNHFGDKHSDMREYIYGVGFPKSNEALYLKRYRAHNDLVIEHFKGREDQLLVVCWEDDDGWEKICDFLNKPIPSKTFPHANKRGSNTENSTLISRLYNKLFK
jgi:hypothetical protein